MIEWRYIKIGECDYCPDDNTPLRAPVVDGERLRTVVAPLFCPACRTRYEKLVEKLVDPNTALAEMTRETRAT